MWVQVVRTHSIVYFSKKIILVNHIYTISIQRSKNANSTVRVFWYRSISNFKQINAVNYTGRTVLESDAVFLVESTDIGCIIQLVANKLGLPYTLSVNNSSFTTEFFFSPHVRSKITPPRRSIAGPAHYSIVNRTRPSPRPPYTYKAAI